MNGRKWLADGVVTANRTIGERVNDRRRTFGGAF